MQTPILQCGFRSISAKFRGLGMGGKISTSKTCQRSVQSLVTAGLCLHWVHMAAVAGWIQVPSVSPELCISRGKKGSLFFFPSFSAAYDVQIPLEREIAYWFSLLDFMSGAFLSALWCSMLFLTAVNLVNVDV